MTIGDYRKLVDKIQSVLYSITPATDDVVEQLLQEQLAVCEEVNERLRHCGLLLDQGLRSEAIQASDNEPNLLDVVAVLDFPEQIQWLELLGKQGFIGPPALMVDVAADLNAAYAVEKKLAPLLRSHRLLALAHAPLYARTRILQQIAKVDRLNPVWNEDLRHYEEARLAEVGNELERAMKQDNFAKTNALRKELRDDFQFVKPPASLRKKSEEYYRDLEHRKSLQGLQVLGPQLHEAFCQNDVSEGRRLRRLWQKCVDRVSQDEADGFQEGAAPALDWLIQQDKFEKELQDAEDDAGHETE